MSSPDLDSVTAVICRVGKVPTVGPDQDMFEAGVSSVDALEVLLELEITFDVSIPDNQFVRARTPRALTTLLTRLGAEAA